MFVAELRKKRAVGRQNPRYGEDIVDDEWGMVRKSIAERQGLLCAGGVDVDNTGSVVRYNSFPEVGTSIIPRRGVDNDNGEEDAASVW